MTGAHINALLSNTEHPDVKSFALHPGSIPTDMSNEVGAAVPREIVVDTLQLPAYTLLRLTSGFAA